MHKGIAGAIGVAVLAAAGFGGLAAWQGSEVDAFHGKTIPPARRRLRSEGFDAEA